MCQLRPGSNPLPYFFGIGAGSHPRDSRGKEGDLSRNLSILCNVGASIRLAANPKQLSEALAVHLMAEAEFCPLTGELLGPTRLKRRQLDRMELQSLDLPKWPQSCSNFVCISPR